MADPSADSPPARFRVPAHAWAWLQRSRPVLDEVALQLTGCPPTPAWLDELRVQLTTDPFVHDVVLGVVADVAFHGRLPTRRPPGNAWDRGLTWWAATIAGTTPREFEARSGLPGGTQRPLFDAPPAHDAPAARRTAPVARVPRPPLARTAVAAVLRQLLAAADGDHVPASVVRQLLADLEAP